MNSYDPSPNTLDTSSPSKSIHLVIPDVAFPTDTHIKVRDSEMVANPKSRQARVLQFFGNNPDGVLKRENLLELLHQTRLEYKIAAIHFEGSLWRNSHQVMSRLRKTLTYCFARHMPPGTEWLPYCESLGGWILYKLPGYGSDGGWHS